MPETPRKKWYKPYRHEAQEQRMAPSRQDMVSDRIPVAQSNLGQVVQMAQEIADILYGLDDIPDWVEDKISKARAMLGTVEHFLGEFEEAIEDDEAYDDEAYEDEEA